MQLNEMLDNFTHYDYLCLTRKAVVLSFNTLVRAVLLGLFVLKYGCSLEVHLKTFSF